MPRNEDGEFELILGNRQLLSVFFIVVILLGVFFTMGYIVGRNSSPLSADARKDRPVVVDPGTRPNPASSDPIPAPVETPAVRPAEPVPAAPAPVDAQEQTKTQPAKPSPAKPEVAKAPEVATAIEKPKPASPLPDQPVSGQTYLQLTAVAKAEAQLFVDVLAKKGFHAIYVPVPDKPQMYRVLVGPIKDTGAVNQTRSDLEKAGFQGLKALMRKF